MEKLKDCTFCSREFNNVLARVAGNYIYDNGKIISKQEVLRRAKIIASYFDKGEFISNSLPNSPEWWMVTLAAFLSGATVVVYSNEKKQDDIISRNAEYGVKTAFFTEKDVQSFLATHDKIEDGYPCDGGLVLFTSGTQFNPKGVLIEYSNYIPAVFATQNKLCMHHTDRNSCFAPYSHAMGFMYGLCDFLYGGDYTICRNQLEFINLIISRNLDVACMQPAFLESMIKLDKFTDAIVALRYVLIAGAPISQPAYEFYYNKGARILNAYGMTECVAAIAITDYEQNNNNDRSLDIMDSAVIKISEDGEVLVSGPTVCKQYLEGNAIPSNDGWYHTHDMGRIQNGRLYVSGRMDNVIVCENGYKISLEGIEDKVLKISEIDDCVAEYIDKHLVFNIVSHKSQEELYSLVDNCLEYFERPFKIKKVEKIEVHNGKKRRKHQ